MQVITDQQIGTEATIDDSIEVLHDAVQTVEVLKDVGIGMPGPPGASAADLSLVFQIANRLNELTTPEARAAARANLDLTTVDGGTFN